MKKWFIFIVLTIIGFLIIFKKTDESYYNWIDEKISQTITGLSSMYKTIYDNIYKTFGELRNLDWKLLKAIALTESNEDASVIGDDGRSFGLMQVSLVVGNFYGMNKDDLLIPELNVQAGSAFLKEMIEKYGLEGGIQAYNLGQTKFRKGLTSPNYLKKVLDYYDKLKTIYV